MKCEFCEERGAVILVCGHIGCQEHTVFIREQNKLIPACISCYEEGRNSYLSYKEECSGS